MQLTVLRTETGHLTASHRSCAVRTDPPRPPVLPPKQVRCSPPDWQSTDLRSRQALSLRTQDNELSTRPGSPHLPLPLVEKAQRKLGSGVKGCGELQEVEKGGGSERMVSEWGKQNWRRPRKTTEITAAGKKRDISGTHTPGTIAESSEWIVSEHQLCWSKLAAAWESFEEYWYQIRTQGAEQ